jgi:predicted TIM-barrel fold metal-dependent hydrolase
MRLVRGVGAVLGAAIIVLSAVACDDDDGDGGADPTPTPVPLDVGGAAIDVHTHLMSAELAAGLGSAGASTADDLIERLDEAQVERAVVLSTAYMAALPDDAAVAAENDFVAAEARRYPDRLVFLCGINPLREGAVAEVARCADELDAGGIKLHLVGSRMDMTDTAHVEALARVFDRVQEVGYPVLVHAANQIGLPLDSDGLTSLGTIMAEHPGVKVVLAHCFSQLDNQRLELITEAVHQGLFPEGQLFVDISSCLEASQNAPLGERELIVWRLREFGLEQVLFGSDYLRSDPLAITPAEALAVLARYPFTQDEVDTILRNDASAWLQGE